MKELLSMNRFL